MIRGTGKIKDVAETPNRQLLMSRGQADMGECLLLLKFEGVGFRVLPPKTNPNPQIHENVSHPKP